MHILLRLGLDEKGVCLSQAPENRLFEIRMSFHRPQYSADGAHVKTMDIIFDPSIKSKKQMERLEENILSNIGSKQMTDNENFELKKINTLSFFQQLNLFLCSLLKVGSCFKKFASNGTFSDEIETDAELITMKSYIFEHVSKTFVDLNAYQFERRL